MYKISGTYESVIGRISLRITSQDSKTASKAVEYLKDRGSARITVKNCDTEVTAKLDKPDYEYPAICFSCGMSLFDGGCTPDQCVVPLEEERFGEGLT